MVQVVMLQSVVTINGTNVINGINVSSTIQEESCWNTQDGSIDLTVTGAPSGLTYLWSNNAITQDISNLTGGYYSLCL